MYKNVSTIDEKCRGMHEECVYKLGSATARAAGASPTSEKTCPWIFEQRKCSKTSKHNKKSEVQGELVRL